ncbi:MAG: hypothetical protein IPG44_08095 [Anaerolineales bacterium]|nr:hypothetical protein [Anaerolineales bacterium]
MTVFLQTRGNNILVTHPEHETEEKSKPAYSEEESHNACLPFMLWLLLFLILGCALAASLLAAN